MSIKSKITMLMASGGVSGRGLAAAFNCPPQTIANKVARGIVRIDDLVKIVDACGATLNITTKDGTVITLTLADLEDQAKNKDK